MMVELFESKVLVQKKITENFGTDQHPDSNLRVMDLKIRIWIRTKKSRTRNTVFIQF
jgi:hypothetical protein